MSFTINRQDAPTREHVPLVQWQVVPRVPQLALVGYCEGLPAAVIELDGILRYRLVTTQGLNLGAFPTIGEAQAAFEEHRKGR